MVRVITGRDVMERDVMGRVDTSSRKAKLLCYRGGDRGNLLSTRGDKKKKNWANKRTDKVLQGGIRLHYTQ
jgi:hypothetical protein